MCAGSYILNKQDALVSIGWKTPFEMLFQKKPCYENLRVIGCLGYAASVERGKDKFDPSGKACVLIGYPSHQNGYKLFDKNTKEVCFSRDVLFYEDKFPFADSSLNESVKGTVPSPAVVGINTDEENDPSPGYFDQMPTVSYETAVEEQQAMKV